MTTTIDADLLKNLFNDSTIDNEIAEIIIDQAINLLNAYGAGLSNLSGGTGDYASAEAGAIMTLAQQIYSKHFKNASDENVNLGPAAISYSNDNQLLNFAQQLAFQLKTRSFERT